METKVCIKCNTEKHVTEFHKGWKEGKLNGRCKICIKKYNKEHHKKYYKNNKESIKEYQKEYYKNNKESIKEKKKEYPKEYYENNKERRKEYHKEYYKKNKEVIKEINSRWLDNNKERRKETNKEYFKKRRMTDPLFKLSCNIRKRISESLSKKGYTKKSRTFDILGCSYKDFKEHIESHWEDWMNWDNYGIYNGKENNGWEYDHIVPVSSAECEEDIYRLNHHSNIQPLCSYVNRYVKRDIVDWKS